MFVVASSDALPRLTVPYDARTNDASDDATTNMCRV